MLAVGLLAAATVWGLTGGRKWGFLGAWFLLILAPTSSFMPLGQLAFEHRMYLSLAAVIAAALIGGDLLLSGLLRRLRVPESRRATMQGTIAMVLVLSATALLCVRTRLRNEDYRTDLSIWGVTIQQRPMNARPHNNLGNALLRRGRLDAAITEYRRAVEIDRCDTEAGYNLADALQKRGDVDAAIAEYRKVLEINPHDSAVHNNLGNILAGRGQTDEAVTHFQMALRAMPDFTTAHYNLGNAFADRGEITEAIVQYRRTLECEPDFAGAHYNLGNALFRYRQIDEAITHYRKALEIQPHHAEARTALGAALAGRGEIDAAMVQYQEALRIKPDLAAARYNLAQALLGCGRVDEAIFQYQKVVEIQPGNSSARRNLDVALLARERLSKTLAARRDARHGRPNDAALLNDIAWTLATSPFASLRKGTEAVELADKASKISGGREPAVLGTLAAAYAETGRFREAVTTAQEAEQLATVAGRASLAAELRVRRELYRQGKPYREPIVAAERHQP
jgi:tetratricopeptide (TPR) repeat protein